MLTGDLIATVNALNDRSEYRAALDAVLPALDDEAADYALWIGAGNAYYGLKRFDEAKDAYLKAAALNPDDAVALSNLAGVCFETASYDEGLEVCDRALKRQPDYANALIHRGNMLASLDRHREAEDAYRQALRIVPDDALVLFNMANTLTVNGKYDEAERIYERLTEISPRDVEYLFAFASFWEKREAFDKAAEIYLRLLQVQPEDVTHITLSGCLYNLLLQGKTDRVMALTDEWLTLFPDNPAALHTLETLKNSKEVRRASAEYVQELFDAFAESFDTVLEGLNYQAPALIAEAVKTISFDRPPAVLDLGCGTGLCAAAMKEKGVETASLTGIDLSAGMLEKAEERGLYASLRQADITTVLPTLSERFDLAVCADVLTYLGDLSAVFSGLSAVIDAGGRLVFTVSENTENDAEYTMELSGRFMHSQKYIQTLSEQNGFDVAEVRSVELRQELGQPVKGFLFVVNKK